MFENLKCKNYPDKCIHSDEIESIYKHGNCLDCEYTPNEGVDYYKNNDIINKATIMTDYYNDKRLELEKLLYR